MEIKVRYRRPCEPQGLGSPKWENEGGVQTFKSWRKAWEYVDGAYPLWNPLTREYVGEGEVRKHVRKINLGLACGVEKDDCWFLDIFGVEEAEAKAKYLAELNAKLDEWRELDEKL